MHPRFNIALALTWLRIAAIPMIVLVFMWPGDWSKPIAAVIFTLAGLTDWLDGYLARKLNLTSRFGAFLDPVADKLMVSTALVLILWAAPQHEMPLVPGHEIILTLCAAIIIGREIVISALREWMAELGARNAVAVTGIAKLKTIFQLVGVGAMLYTYPVFGFIPLYGIGFILVVTASGLTIWSMYIYLKAAWPQLTAPE
ncbi:MAG: CDP-diacylglycerol--glycerol-3-phosphate 3-phosphatidyltransferase [Gammaproteobacteria bacterium]|nr:CDP-diacylglycerol--glycerol-3-phosphate 3-phosphatidyltransferase [Gammaproteobacteria bacterium]MCP4090460.1 CDP-diacylglycerol--glycerol-3-phosphate 3-phosphatidyltransferase [Gammaproteobacteria bacterium]MCP4275435.1 CDP-diacylglycerol--glycerol-3-phosphate 3-phosphatidyltransferase [Gammaproteobacteria bacterium]MCP4832588.1 CDP-diacylglycerol--glycerol-3-phosphate 3-phosphatidyltransferase [Gammaproteobacteria bacterium]MCP4928107.1 CDP-diacylglycerol--glycerol-3-phosphate 3-phosphati